MKKNDGLALVTGAASGIGKASVLRLLRDGWRVIALDRDRKKLEVLAAEVAQPDRLFVVESDLNRTVELPGIVEKLLAQHGPITALANVAGVWDGAPIISMTDQQWNLNFTINVTAPFVLMRSIAPGMIRAGGGGIVNISSRNAFRSSTGKSAYDASKAALVALTRTAAGELARHNIRVNAICPGVIATPGDAAAIEDKLFKAAYTRLIPMGRYGTADEIAGAIAFLLSNDASFLTGQAIIIDGGQIACQDNERFMEIPGLKA